MMYIREVLGSEPCLWRFISSRLILRMLCLPKHHLSSITAEYASQDQMCKPLSCFWRSELPGAGHAEVEGRSSWTVHLADDNKG